MMFSIFWKYSRNSEKISSKLTKKSTNDRMCWISILHSSVPKYWIGGVSWGIVCGSEAVFRSFVASFCLSPLHKYPNCEVQLKSIINCAASQCFDFWAGWSAHALAAKPAAKASRGCQHARQSDDGESFASRSLVKLWFAEDLHNTETSSEAAG